MDAGIFVRLVEAWEAIGSFMDLGGDVLFVIFLVTLAMWTLILERVWYFRSGHRAKLAEAAKVWAAREDKTSWYSYQIRSQLVSDLAIGLRNSLPLIKTLVALCPLLGLLGTVTGMIEVFDVMAIAGNGNPRAMASGVSKATIPTMAGMVAALSGLYFSVLLERHANGETEKLIERLTEN